ncbi:MAG: LamG domain-containing protein [Thermoguttaceae bacterium]|jgi:hypothetical protein|nr:LamG domain-containing protein [Thermoguttaceae bacterium]
MTARTTSTILVSGLAVAGLMLALAEPGPARASLVGYWTFDADFDDALGGYHATVPAPPGGQSNDVFAGVDNGKLGGAAYFDGSFDALAIPKDVIAGNTFSIAFWEFSPAGSATPQGFFFDARVSDSNINLFLRRIGATGAQYDGRIAGENFLGFSVARDAWKFNVITYDSANARWYVDGNLEKTISTSLAGLSADLWVGNRRTWERDFHGWIDDLGIWNEALPPERIRAIGNVANSTSLNYNLGQAQQLFDIYDAGGGVKGTVGTLPWRHVSSLNTAADPGALVKIDGRDHLILGGDSGSRSGVASIGLVGHWTFDGHFDDAIGGRHATKPTPPSGTNDVVAGVDNGKIGGAAYFDGDNDALMIDKGVLPTGSKEFTIAFWEFSPAEGAVFTDGYFLDVRAGTNRDIFLRRIGSGVRYAGQMAAGTFGEFAVSRGQWHFNVVTNDSNAGEAKWYVDGVLQATIDASTFNGLRGDLWLGNHSIDWNRDLHGWIDDLGIWNEVLPLERIHAVENLAQWASLNYNLGEAQQLFDIFDAGPGGEGIVGGDSWRYVSSLDLTDAPGTVLNMGGWDYLILGGAEGSRMGVRMIPEPGSAALLLCAVLSLLLFVRRKR